MNKDWYQVKNLNDLAVEISKREGKKKQTDIGQIKEILRIILDLFSNEVVYTSPTDNNVVVKDHGFFQNFWTCMHNSSKKKLNFKIKQTKTKIKKAEKLNGTDRTSKSTSAPVV